MITVFHILDVYTNLNAPAEGIWNAGKVPDRVDGVRFLVLSLFLSIVPSLYLFFSSFLSFLPSFLPFYMFPFVGAQDIPPCTVGDMRSLDSIPILFQPQHCTQFSLMFRCS